METLNDMRKSIDNIDNAIVAMFAERFKVTNRVVHYKAKNGLLAKDAGRESEQYIHITRFLNRNAKSRLPFSMTLGELVSQIVY